MRTEHRRNRKPSWPKTVVKKWLNIRSGAEEFHSDYKNKKAGRVGGVQERRKSCSDGMPDMAGGWLVERCENLKAPQFLRDVQLGTSLSKDNLRVFVGTWNVGGRAPQEGLELEDWLMSMPLPADIYVLGFQEVVPLTAGNVLGAESKRPADTWTSLIRRTLNRPAGSGRNYKSATGRVSFSDLLALADPDPNELLTNKLSACGGGGGGGGGYCLAVSKQMVGIFLSVWVRTGVMSHVTGLKVSCVGTGILGYMGNKGSVSISMRVGETTTLCLVCSHLTSGEKDGDELRRNSDVAEILKKTRFPRNHLLLAPDTILEHDKIIWLGDLNYRLATGCEETHDLLERMDWHSLLEKDQLKMEQKAGRVFEGWEEGNIHFPPTYKYSADSDSYVVGVSPSKSKEKRRTPAWCDRILWRGEGLKQLSYARGESRFSDHRPVSSLFSVHVDTCVAAHDEPVADNADRADVVAVAACTDGDDPTELLVPLGLTHTPLESARF